MQNSLFWWRFSIKSEDYFTNYGFLKRIISADDVVSEAFRWHTRQNELGKMKGLQLGTYSVISWPANFQWWIQHIQSGSAGERYFSAAWNLSAWLRSTMTQERFSNLKVLNSHKERTAKLPLHHFKRVGYRPPHFKNYSAGPEGRNLTHYKNTERKTINNLTRINSNPLLINWFSQ